MTGTTACQQKDRDKPHSQPVRTTQKPPAMPPLKTIYPHNPVFITGGRAQNQRVEGVSSDSNPVYGQVRARETRTKPTMSTAKDYPNEIVLLDGGTGTELQARGVEVPSHKTSIWSALALRAAPEAIVGVHRDYIEAGARVITACNYAVTPPLLRRENCSEELEELTLLAVSLARRAADESGKNVRVAASLPPLETSYRADLVPDSDTLEKEYGRIAALLAPRVEILLCETFALGREARIAAEIACATKREVWLSWTLQGNRFGQLPSGETLEDAFAQSNDLPVDAHLVNCAAANLITDAMPRLARISGEKFGGYANAANALPGPFNPQDPEDFPQQPLDEKRYADAVEKWVATGARIVGGCCFTRPSYIEEIRQRLSLREERLTAPPPRI